MKTKICKKENRDIVRINFILLLCFFALNDADYFSTYLSIIDGGVEINPIVQIMLHYPLYFFIWKIILLPLIVWYFVYENDSKKIMWSMVGVNLFYLIAVVGNLRVIL